jgi:IclR family transcriptional regulator, pca regulon regulatory protein
VPVEGNRGSGQGGGSVQSLVRGLDILFCVCESDAPMSPADLAASLDLPRPTVYRLVDTLVTRGLLARQGRSLVPTPRLLMLGGTNRAMLSLRGVAHPHLQRLLAEVGETAGLHIRVGDHRMCVEEIEGHHGIRWARGVGFTAPVWSGAVGHVLLAGIPEQAREEVYERIELTPLAANSVRSIDELRERVDLARERGWSSSRSETVDGAAATAAPVHDEYGTVAVMSLYAPADRFDVLHDHVDDLLRAAGDASRDWTAIAPGAASRASR